MKIVINTGYCGFGLSNEAIQEYIKRKGLNLYDNSAVQKDNNSFYTVPFEEYQSVLRLEEEEYRKKIRGENHNYKGHPSNSLCWDAREIERNDNTLVQILQEMGPRANGKYACLKIVEIPDDVDYVMCEMDGI